MDAIGNVTHDEATHRAECVREDCGWKIETPVAGKAAKELMHHNAEEHGVREGDGGGLVTDEIVEAAAAALWDSRNPPASWASYTAHAVSAADAYSQFMVARTRAEARSAVLASAPLIAGRALREAQEVITTHAELDALPVGSVVMEGTSGGGVDYTTVISTMPGVFHRFPQGWYVVAGIGPHHNMEFPMTVLHRADRIEAS